MIGKTIEGSHPEPFPEDDHILTGRVSLTRLQTTKEFLAYDRAARDRLFGVKGTIGGIRKRTDSNPEQS